MSAAFDFVRRVNNPCVGVPFAGKCFDVAFAVLVEVVNQPRLTRFALAGFP